MNKKMTLHKSGLYIYIFLLFKGIMFAEGLTTVQQALEYVFKIRGSNCGHGTGEVLPLQFDVTAWNQYTDPAIRTANFLSKILETNDGTLDSMTDEMFFLLVRNNVHGDSLIFGSAIAIEKGVYRSGYGTDSRRNFTGALTPTSLSTMSRTPRAPGKYDIFCPYAYKKNSTVYSHDISINYNYLDPQTEWYNSVKDKSWTNVTLATDGIMYRKDNELLPEVTEVYPIAELADGHWTNPYYDCGGGDIWMVTYSSPIFKVTGGTAHFQGVATIDIELTYIDINQCDNVNGMTSSGLDVFRGTHRCQITTTCVSVAGKGFVPGAYMCVCNKGYYFPRLNTDTPAYKGEDIEDYFRREGSIGGEMFQCLKCAVGCDTCVDDSPCLHQRNQALLVTLAILDCITVFAIVCIAVITYLYRAELVIKSASPIFLELMCLGGILICVQFFTEIPTPSTVVCSLRIWPQHLGFFVMYGSLILKTWRISMIFTVGMQKRVHLPDQVLLQRFGLLVLLTIAILVAWNTSQLPEVETLETSGELKFYVCEYGPWEYAVTGVKIILLLYGVYLCYTVRKAPAHFNESKHITWAVYNAIILGSFMLLLSRIFISVVGPDFMLLFQFAQIQVYATVTLLILFSPKFLAIKNKVEVEPHNPAVGTYNTIQTVTGRIKKTQIAPLPQVRKVHTGTQTAAWDV